MSRHPLLQNTDNKPGVHGVGFDEIRQYHMKKNIDMLNNMVDENSPIMRINCALCDSNEKKAEALIQSFQSMHHYSIYNASESITNKSRMRIAFLASDLERPQTASLFLNLCNQAVLLGHDVLLFSHTRLPKDAFCNAVFFLAHPKSDLSGLVPAVDAVIAENWHLAPQALRIRAPLKFFIADHSLFHYPFLNQPTKSALQKAYGLPIRILSFSNALAALVHDLFGRDAVIFPLPADANALVSVKEEGNPLRLLIASNSNDTPHYTDALGALCYLNANGIEYRIHSIVMENNGPFSNYDLNVTEHFRPTRSELLGFLHKTDVYLDLSHDDCLSYEIIHALASGCVPVLFGSSLVLSGLTNEYNCILFNPFKPPGVANALQKAAINHALRRRIAKNGRRLVKTHTNKALKKALQHELGATVLQAVMD